MIDKILPKFSHLKWYDKTLLSIIGTIVFTGLFVASCTCSLQKEIIVNFLKPIFVLVQTIEYLSILLIIVVFIFKKEKHNQYLQIYGLIIIVSVLLVSALSYLPCMQGYATKNTIFSILKRSLFCPEFSLKSWINLLWLGILGSINYTLAIIFRFQQLRRHNS